MSACPSIVQGYSKSCRDTQGGVKQIYITELSNKATLTTASGVITAFTLSSGKKFWLYEQELNTANGQEVFTGNLQAGTRFVDQTVTVTLLKRQASISYQIKTLAAVNVMVIVYEQTGTYMLYGATNGMWLDPSTSTTGTNMGDSSNYVLVFKGMEPEGAFEVPSDILAVLIEEAA